MFHTYGREFSGAGCYPQWGTGQEDTYPGISNLSSIQFASNPILLPFRAANTLQRLICAPPWHVPFCSLMNLLQPAFHICPINCPIKGTSFHHTQPSGPPCLHHTELLAPCDTSDHSLLLETLVSSAAFQERFADGPSISWLCLGCPSPWSAFLP